MLHDLRPNFSTTCVRKSGSGGVKSSLLENIAIHGLAVVVFSRPAELCVLCISNYIESFPRNPSLLCINCSLTFHRWFGASLDWTGGRAVVSTNICTNIYLYLPAHLEKSAGSGLCSKLINCKPFTCFGRIHQIACVCSRNSNLRLRLICLSRDIPTVVFATGYINPFTKCIKCFVKPIMLKFLLINFFLRINVQKENYFSFQLQFDADF